MEWMKPEFEEISLNCEINSYANAELYRACFGQMRDGLRLHIRS